MRDNKDNVGRYTKNIISSTRINIQEIWNQRSHYLEKIVDQKLRLGLKISSRNKKYKYIGAEKENDMDGSGWFWTSMNRLVADSKCNIIWMIKKKHMISGSTW